MSRILEAVHNVSRADDEKVCIESSLGAFMQLVEDGVISANSTYADWMDLAMKMDPYSSGRTRVEARTNYPFNNICQLWHQQLYGNRTVEEAQRGERLHIDNNRFSSINNLALAQAKWERMQDEEDGMNGPSAEKDQAYVEYEEALRWNAYCLSEYAAAKNKYEAIFSVPFAYKPYEDRVKVPAGTAKARAIAAELRASRKSA